MTTGLIPNWYPPSPGNYDIIVNIWKWFPVGASLQWLVSWYGMGKTSITNSRLNVPGRLGWLTMEAPGFLTLLYNLRTLPAQTPGPSSSAWDLPWQNKILACLFVTHYLYRAILYPFLQPSMSEIHILVWGFALCFQLFNGTAIGAWLAAYGPTTPQAWESQLSFGNLQFFLGVAIFFGGLYANYWHDGALRDIRRAEARRQAKVAKEEGRPLGTIEKHYEIPTAGLFSIMLYPHYFVEWVEWFGFWMAAGWSCLPAALFFVNEVASMLPRAVNGKGWYVKRFGEDKLRGKYAVIPGVW